jgi:hypothetical protein
MVGLTILILGLLLGACKLEIPIDINKMMISNAELIQQKREIDRDF